MSNKVTNLQFLLTHCGIFVHTNIFCLCLVERRQLPEAGGYQSALISQTHVLLDANVCTFVQHRFGRDSLDFALENAHSGGHSDDDDDNCNYQEHDQDNPIGCCNTK